tara:strand:+ start:251 stop:979 length:729 start_codon:yes stop_codon:yes gene_type:complete
MNYINEFKYVGSWKLDENSKSNKNLAHLNLCGINFYLDKESDDKKNLVYLFRSNNKTFYIGQTTRDLKSRFYDYKRGFDNEKDTDSKVKIEITNRLSKGEEIEIFYCQPKTVVQFAGEKIEIPISKPIEELLIAKDPNKLNIQSRTNEKLNSIYQCPICKTDLQPSTKYPNYVCSDCVNKASDKQGQPLSFGNIDMGGGFEAFYTETNKKHDSHICYIEGIECFADEEKFGGIVIEVKKNKG